MLPDGFPLLTQTRPAVLAPAVKPISFPAELNQIFLQVTRTLTTASTSANSLSIRTSRLAMIDSCIRRLLTGSSVLNLHLSIRPHRQIDDVFRLRLAN